MRQRWLSPYLIHVGLLLIAVTGLRGPDARAEFVEHASPPADGGIVTPANGASLNARYVLFTFPPVPEAVGYQLQIVIFDGTPDPFDNEPIVDVEISRPRRIVREPLEFGGAYVWRSRGLMADGAPGVWSAGFRFGIQALPDELVGLASAITNDAQRYQSGVTLCNLIGVPGGEGFHGAVFDRAGEIVWFLSATIWDIRMQRNGNLLHAGGGRAREIRLDGTEVWVSHEGALDPHEAFEMPNGNVMAMKTTNVEVMRDDELQTWRSQRLVEMTRTGQTVWTWTAIDHLSTLDFDECAMQFPLPGNVYDWLHGNGVVYDAVQNAVYYSPRNLSRIVKIDYDTGDIVWNLGFDMPSGEVDFGDDLFSYQHAPQILENGNVLLYDNGNRRGHSFCTAEDPFSAVVELAVDPGALEPVTVAWEFLPDAYTPFFGDADRLPNGNTLVAVASLGRLLEVAADGDVVWELSLTLGDFYRAERIASLYPLRGDADGDDDTDLVDFAGMQACFAGADVTAIQRACLVHDMDEDGDVDLDDFDLFDASFTGPGP